MHQHTPSTLPRRPRRRRRSPLVRHASPRTDPFAEELLRLYDEGHRCFCPECRVRAREQELARRRRDAGRG